MGRSTWIIPVGSVESQASLIRGRWNCSQRGVRLEAAALLALKVEERLGAKE